MDRSRIKKTLIQNLREIRRSNELSTTDLAKILGVSQSKISYIENGKGVLSVEDIVVISRKLNVPITDFFSGLTESEDLSGAQKVVAQLVHHGAILLAKPKGIVVKPQPFSEVLTEALVYLKDDRINKGLCAATIANVNELDEDLIFGSIGGNAYLVDAAAKHCNICAKVVRWIWEDSFETAEKTQIISPSVTRKIAKLESVAQTAKSLLRPEMYSTPAEVNREDIAEIARFVKDCLDGKK